MLTRTGKIIFGLILLVVVVVIGGLFLISNPGKIEVPGITNPISTPSTKFDESTLAKLESPFSSYGIDVDAVYSGIFWSGNGRYILFEGQSKPVANQLEAPSYIILGDLEKGTFKKIYDGAFGATPSWGATTAVFSSDGVYAYNAATSQMSVVSPGPHQAPRVSPDETKVVYADNGLVLYSIATGASNVLTKSNGDIPGVWYPDNTKLLYFKSDGTNLGDGAGMRQSVARIDLVTKEIQDFPSIPKGKFRTAKWLDKDHVYIMGGFDDGRNDYILNVSTGASHTFIENGLLGEYYFEAHDGRAYAYHTGELIVSDYSGNEIKKTVLEGSWSPADAVPYAMRIFGDKAVLTYVPLASSQAVLRVWDIDTGMKEKDIAVPEGTAVFWSEGDYYAVLKSDSSALAIRKIEL